MGVKPTRIYRPRELLSVESIVGDVSGTDVDWGTSPIGIPAASGRDQWKQPVRVASTASVTVSTALNNGDTIDGVTLATGDRVLLKDQSTGSQNGIYIVGATPIRAADMDDDDEVLGALVYVIAGTTNTATAWKVTNTSAVTVGSTSIVFAAFGTGGSASFATPAIVLGSSAAAGAASTVIRSDSTIAAFDATSPTTQALGDSAVVGTAAFAARRDHKHAMPTAAVTTSGLTQTTARLLGRTTASTGAIEEITVGTGLSLSAGSLTATGGGGGGSVPTYIANTTYADSYPGSADTHDDEFDDSSGMSGSVNGLNARWAWRNQGGATIAYTTHLGWGTISCSASSTENWRIIEQTIADGTYDLRCDLEGRGDRYAGFGLWDGVNGDGWFLGFGVETGTAYILVQRKTNVTTHNNNVLSLQISTSATSLAGDMTAFPLRLRLVRAGTAIELWWAFGEYDWRRVYSGTEDAIATKMGVMVNEKANTGLTKLHINYFRKVA